MYRLRTLLAGIAVVCIAVPLQAYKPADAPRSAGLQKSSAQKSVDPFTRGLKSLRRMTLDDLFDSAQDQSLRQLAIKTFSSAGTEVPGRINKQLQHLHSSVRVTRIDRDKIGLLHIRLSQFYRGIPVIGSDMIVHIDKNNKIFAVSGSIAPLLDVDTAASVRLTQARLAAEQSVDSGTRSPKDSSNLVVFDGKLAYQILVGGKNAGPQLYKCYVDAKSGEVLYKQNQIMPSAPGAAGAHVPVSGTRLTGEGGNVVSITGWHDAGGNYFLYNKDSVWGVYNLVSGDWEQRPTSSWGTSDPAAVSLGKNFSIIQDYVKQVDGINSFNNGGMFAKADVHEGTNYVNAYWDGSEFHFGDGDGVEAGPLTVLDVAAHEYGHAITQYTSNLNYSYESGALNESFSDIHGTLVEFWAEPDGRSSYPNKTVGAADWLCGEDCWLSGVALRDLRNPQRFSQPSYYMGTLWYTGGGDNGGVHYNSGVQNFAFYLLAEGGSGTNDGHSYNITGLGIQHAGDVAMYANMHLLTSGAQYRDTRDAWIMAASLLGYNATTVADVWTACGVLPLVKHLSVSPSSLAFGSVGVGSSDTLSLLLSNNGASSTIVTGLTSGDPWFTAAAAVPFTVAGGGTYTLKVACNPSAYESRTSSLTIASNADDNPSISVGLSGTGVAPAVMSLTPSSLHATVLAGDSSQQALQCSNTGTAPLKIRITKTEVDTPVANWKGVQRWNYSLSPENGNDGSARPVQAAATESAIVTSPFFDGFEQGNFNNWTPGPGSYVRSVTNATAASGQYSFTQAGGNSTHFDGVSATLTTPQQPDMISFSVRAQSNTLYHGYFVLCGAGNAEVIWFSMGGTGYLYANGNETYPYSGNTWYNIRFQLNWVAAMFDYYVNNVLVASAIPFRNNTPITTIYLYNFYNSQAWWDNINFGGASENTWLTCVTDTATIFSGHSLTIPVALNSTGLSGGNYAGSLSIFHNAPATPSPKAVPCTLTVRGVRRLAVSPAAFSFGNVWAGAHASAAFTLKNPGTEATQVDSVVCDNPAFTQALSLPLVVRASDSARVTITFSPPVSGSYTGTVSIKSNAEDNPVCGVPVSGTGTSAPVAQLTPASLTYSLQHADSPVAKVSALSNIGGDLLTYLVTTAEVSRPAQGAPGLAWLSVTPASGSLLPGAQQNLTVVVNPAGCAAGQWNGLVTVTSNDPAHPQVTVAVSATVSGCRTLSVDKNILDFGTIWAGTNKQLLLLLTNSCNDSVVISSLSFTNPAFVTNAVCPFKVPAFGTVSVSAGFAPIDSGNKTGTLTIQSNAEDNPAITVQLQGRSLQPPRLSVSPPAFKETLNPGDSVSRTLNISNAGGDTLSININPQTISQPQGFQPVSIDDSVQRGIQNAARSISLITSDDTSRTKVSSTPRQDYSSLSNKNILLLRDNLAWGYNVNVPLLQALGATITIASSSQMSGINLQPFSCIVFESQQPMSFYTTYQANLGKFEAYVRNGGILEFHCAAYSSDRVPILPFPGGTTTLASFAGDNTNYTVDRSHPITAGADSIVTGNYASHEAFTAVPANATLLTVNTANQPTTVVYRLGNGLVIATGMTWEWGYANGYDCGRPFLPNALSYSVNAQQNSWLTAVPSALKVPPQQSLPVTVQFKAVNLLAGNFAGSLAITHNDPLTPSPFALPCTMTVNSLRSISASPTTANFGARWIGSTTPLTVTFTNSGNDTTRISSITCDNGVFTHTATLPLIVPPFGSATTTIRFAPVANVTSSGTIVITSNAGDNPSLTLTATGSGIVPPTISVAPQSFHEALSVLSSVTRTLSIANSGQDTLRFQASDTMAWLGESATSGLVLPGSFTNISITFSSSGLVAGNYKGALLLSHNDPNRVSPLAVPCTLDVNAVRHCTASPSSVAFGTVHIGSQASQTVTLTNSGNAATTISAINGASAVMYYAATLPLTVPAFGSTTFSVIFKPAASGTVSGALSLEGNAVENPLSIALNGTGVEPPHISTAPAAINEWLQAGGSSTKTLTVYNTGGDILHFTSAAIDMSGVAAAPVPQYDASHFVTVDHGRSDTRVGLGVATSSGGPDSYGYRWIDSDQSGGPAYVWNDISASGTVIAGVTGCGDCYAQVNFSMPFNFYGTTYHSCWITTKGFVSFLNGSYLWTNYPLPSSSAPGGIICAFWDDLSTAANGQVYMKEDASHVTFQWNNIHPYGGSGNMYTFQMVLGIDGSIYLYYKSMTGTVTSATVGIQNQTATTGLTVAYNTAYIKNNLAIRISKQPTWLSINIASGAIPPSGSVPIAVTFNAAQLIQGTYNGVVRFTHDDPSQASPFGLPVSLIVSPTGGLKCAILRIGPSMVASVQGASYRVKTVTLGDVTAGVMRGNLYQLRLMP